MKWQDALKILPDKDPDYDGMSITVMISSTGTKADNFASYNFSVGAWYTDNYGNDAKLVSPKYWAFIPEVNTDII